MIRRLRCGSRGAGRPRRRGSAGARPGRPARAGGRRGTAAAAPASGLAGRLADGRPLAPPASCKWRQMGNVLHDPQVMGEQATVCLTLVAASKRPVRYWVSLRASVHLMCL